MDFSQKQELQSKITWLHENISRLNRLEKINQLMEIFSPLLKNENYDLTRYQVLVPPKIMMIVLPFDFSAFNKSNPEDKIGIMIDSGRSSFDNASLHILTKNAETQKCNRTIIISEKSITTEERRKIYDYFTFRVELIDVLHLKGWVSKLCTEIDDVKEFNILLKSFSDKLAKQVAQKSIFLHEIEWRDLERMIAEILEEFGLDVTLTPSSKDGGKDLIVLCNSGKTSKSYIIELKHWRSNQKVGSKHVKEFINVIINEKRDKGLFLSTYGFADNAFEGITEFQRKLVKHGEEQKIVSMCELYLKRRSGLWIPDKSAEEILFEKTN